MGRGRIVLLGGRSLQRHGDDGSWPHAFFGQQIESLRADIAYGVSIWSGAVPVIGDQHGRIQPLSLAVVEYRHFSEDIFEKAHLVAPHTFEETATFTMLLVASVSIGVR